MTTAGQILGTPAYMPPEQWGQLPEDGGSSIDARTDVYSLGVMLVEMVAGRLPFEGKSLHDLRVAHALEVPPRLSDLVADIPESASEAVSRALSKDRSSRQASAGQFLAEVRGSAAPLAPTVAAFEALDTRRVNAPSALPSIRWQWIAVAAVLLAAVACGKFFGIPPFGAGFGSPPEPRPAAAAVETHTVSVRLLAQRTQNGVTRVESFAPGDDIVFGNGDGVRLEAETSHSGYVYFINEAPTLDPETALPRYTVIFPRPGEDGGAVPVMANAVVRVPEYSWIEFFGTAGRETVWVVWSAEPVAELRDIETLVTPERLGLYMTDPAKVEAVRRFLGSTLNAPRSARSTSTGQPTTHEFAASGDVIVFPLYFEHR